MDDLELIADLHRDAERQGPGGADETRRAVALSNLTKAKDLAIADIGCGTGASTRVLARALDARITAIDFLPGFLDRLTDLAEQAGLDDRIDTRVQSMDALDFDPQSLDAIWSEGAIYNIGFEAGIRAWRHFLKPGGILAVSELVWLTAERPADLDRHWSAAYPEVATASAKMAILETLGFTPIGYFPLPERCWRDNYYRPMQKRFTDFLTRHGDSEAVRSIVKAEEAEIALYERYSAYYGYGYFVAKRVPE